VQISQQKRFDHFIIKESEKEVDDKEGISERHFYIRKEERAKPC
jgi:hypothetical protein